MRVTVTLLLLFAAEVSASNLNHGQAMGSRDYAGPVGPPPKTFVWEYGTEGDVLPRIVMTIPDITPGWTWDGVEWHGLNVMPGWSAANNIVKLIIDEAHAADYGLDWDAYEAAMENPLYVWRYMRFGDFEQARYYAKLATPERPWTSRIFENVVMDYITVKVQYS